MIDIPEERILKEITDILMNDLPKVLLELEEQSEDNIRLPPFRYVGLEENLPPGTGLPYAFVEIEEGEYTEKDRIIKKQVFLSCLALRLSCDTQAWKYLAAIGKAVTRDNTSLLIKIESKKRAGLLRLRLIIK